MKHQILLMVAFAYVLFTVTESKPTHVCEPGSQFKVQCNDCRCNLEGTDMLCTRKLCPEFENMVEEDATKKSTHEAKPAAGDDKKAEEKPGSEDCDKTHEGSTATGDKQNTNEETPASGGSPNATEGKPDSDNCNGEKENKENNSEGKGTGSGNGGAVEPENKPSDADETCTPGETYKHRCNVCTCPSSGKKSSDACTLALCGDDD